MLLRSENFTNDEGIEMIREYYGELNEDGSENITTIHECPKVEDEIVVEETAKESSVQEVLTSLADAATKEDVERILKEVKVDITNLENTINATLYYVGCVGTVFTATHNDNLYEPLVTELTEEDYATTNGDRYRIVSIPTGSYTITVELGNGSTDVVVDVTNRGTRYFVPYEITVFEQKTAGTATLSLKGDITNVIVTACGGGGGGSGSTWDNVQDSAGSGGGGGACIVDQPYNIHVSEGILNITVGAAGAAGKAGDDSGTNVNIKGGTGGTTIIGSTITLPGGGGGGLRVGGTSGGTGGGAGGRGGYGNSGSAYALAGGAGAKGSGGAGGSSRQTGGGGGGSYGNGGADGGGNGTNGGYGAGGGGASRDSKYYKGGKGGCGLVIIKKVVTSA